MEMTALFTHVFNHRIPSARIIICTYEVTHNRHAVFAEILRMRPFFFQSQVETTFRKYDRFQARSPIPSPVRQPNSTWFLCKTKVLASGSCRRQRPVRTIWRNVRGGWRMGKVSPRSHVPSILLQQYFIDLSLTIFCKKKSIKPEGFWRTSRWSYCRSFLGETGQMAYDAFPGRQTARKSQERCGEDY